MFLCLGNYVYHQPLVSVGLYMQVQLTLDWKYLKANTLHRLLVCIKIFATVVSSGDLQESKNQVTIMSFFPKQCSMTVQDIVLAFINKLNVT